LDTQLRIPKTARLCQRLDKTCWVFTILHADSALGSQVEINTLATDAEGRVNLQEALNLLWTKGIRMLMVEGGSTVITAFIKAQLADALVLTVAPTLVGGYKGVGNLDLQCKSQLPKIRPLHSKMLEDDLIMWGDLEYQS
jgi:riboflavin biosynthesis pyrimidine reductase